MDIRIHRKDCPGETAFWLMNYSEVIARFARKTRAVCAAPGGRERPDGRGARGDRGRGAVSPHRDQRPGASVPGRGWRGRRREDLVQLLSGSSPRRSRIVQGTLEHGRRVPPVDQGGGRIRRASGVDDASIRTQVLNVMARNLDQFGAYTATGGCRRWSGRSTRRWRSPRQHGRNQCDNGQGREADRRRNRQGWARRG